MSHHRGRPALPDLTPTQWLLAIVAAMGIGVSKAGFAGVSLAHVLIFAFLFGARASTGVVLPMLIIGDFLAVSSFKQHARWDYVWKMLKPAAVGIIASAIVMHWMTDALFKPAIGWIILSLAALQIVRLAKPTWFAGVPHSTGFAWTLGLAAGAATMMANAAGPIFALYALAIALPKFEFVGSSAWFFLIVNVFKVPFSLALGLIHGQTLLLNIVLTPAIIVGLAAGRWLITRVSQRLFDGFLLAFAAIAALRLIGAF